MTKEAVSGPVHGDASLGAVGAPPKLPAFTADLIFEGIMEPNPHPAGVPPFWRGRHFDRRHRTRSSRTPSPTKTRTSTR